MFTVPVWEQGVGMKIVENDIYFLWSFVVGRRLVPAGSGIDAAILFYALTPSPRYEKNKINDPTE